MSQKAQPARLPADSTHRTRRACLAGKARADPGKGKHMAAPGGAAVVRHQDGVRPGDDIAGARRYAGDPVEDLGGALQRVGLCPPGGAAVPGGADGACRPHRFAPQRAEAGHRVQRLLRAASVRPPCTRGHPLGPPVPGAPGPARPELPQPAGPQRRTARPPPPSWRAPASGGYIRGRPASWPPWPESRRPALCPSSHCLSCTAPDLGSTRIVNDLPRTHRQNRSYLQLPRGFGQRAVRDSGNPSASRDGYWPPALAPRGGVGQLSSIPRRSTSRRSTDTR